MHRSSKTLRVPTFLAAILALILPYPERQPYRRVVPVDIPFWSFVLGLAEFLGGGALAVHNGIQMLQQIARGNARAILDNNPGFLGSEEGAIAYGLSGSLNALVWFAMPTTWVLLSIPLVGMMRLVSFAASRETSGEFFAWVLVRLGQLANRQRRGAVKKARFGPRQPDRLIEEPGCDRVLLTSMRQPDWNELVTVEIDECFYKVIGEEERRMPGETFMVYAYKLQVEHENAVIRRLLRYEPFDS